MTACSLNEKSTTPEIRYVYINRVAVEPADVRNRVFTAVFLCIVTLLFAVSFDYFSCDYASLVDQRVQDVQFGRSIRDVLISTISLIGAATSLFFAIWAVVKRIIVFMASNSEEIPMI